MVEGKALLEILKPGLSTTVQDLGRPGYYHLGIPLSGAMDHQALIAANLLVGNDAADAALEAVFMGPEIRFSSDAVVAITGAELPPRIDGVEQPIWTALAIKAGQVLSFGFLKSGARAYIAVAGGIDVPVVLGSRSTYTLGALGGYHGRKLAAGEACAVVESVKAASDVYAPIAGEVVDVNPKLTDAPEILNTDPYGDGWLWKLKPANLADVDALLDAAAYEKVLAAP